MKVTPFNTIVTTFHIKVTPFNIMDSPFGIQAVRTGEYIRWKWDVRDQ